MAQRTQFDLLQLRFLHLGKVVQKRGGAKIAEHGVPGLQIAQRVVPIQISMQHAALVQMGHGSAQALNQLGGHWRADVQSCGIDIACTAFKTGWPGQRQHIGVQQG